MWIIINEIFFHYRIFQDSPSVAFESLMQLITTDITSKQRVNLMTALSSLEGQGSEKENLDQGASADASALERSEESSN